MRKVIVAVLLCSGFLLAQQPPAAAPGVPAPSKVTRANPADVKSIDAILTALYDVISGPPGKRNWDRFRSLFLPGARLIPTGKRPNGENGTRVLSVEDYISGAAPYLEKEGFFEREIARHTDQYSRIVQVFSTYESRHKAGEAPFARGINSIQLVNDGQRWWIVTVFWEPETPATPIPPQFLPKGHRP